MGEPRRAKPAVLAALPPRCSRRRSRTSSTASAPEGFFRAVNKVEPSLIRIEADELTYDLHILLRFELERELVDGALEPRDLPGAWNERVHAYLGIDVPDDAHGVLQDVHWAAGEFGYFPTYSLGNVIAGQLWEAARQALPDLDEPDRARRVRPAARVAARERPPPRAQVLRHRGRRAGDGRADRGRALRQIPNERSSAPFTATPARPRIDSRLMRRLAAALIAVACLATGASIALARRGRRRPARRPPRARSCARGS